MIYRTHVPGPPLSDFVELFRSYEGPGPPHAKERCLPAGTMDLVVDLREDELRVYDGQGHKRFRSFRTALICGAHSEPFVIDTASQASVIGVHSRPGGASPFLGLPAGELRNAHASLETLWGAKAAELRDRLLEAERFEPARSGKGFEITTPNARGGMHGGDAGAAPLVFFGVEDIEAALDRVRGLGGDVEEADVEGDGESVARFGRFGLCRDDQGSPFGLHRPPTAEGEGASELALRGAATIDHVTLRTRDLTAGRRFYEAALGPLGLGLEFEREGILAFGSGEGGRLIVYANGTSGAGVHVAFSAPRREAVDRFHAAALRAGATTARRG